MQNPARIIISACNSKVLLILCITLLAAVNGFSQIKNKAATQKNEYKFYSLQHGLLSGKLNPESGTIKFISNQNAEAFEMEYFGNNPEDKLKIFSRLKTEGKIERCYIDFDINLADSGLWVGNRTLKKLIIKDCHINGLTSYRYLTTKSEVADTLIILDTLSIELSEIGILDIEKISFRGPVRFWRCSMKEMGYITDISCMKEFRFVGNQFYEPADSFISFENGNFQQSTFYFSALNSFTMQNLTFYDSISISVDSERWDTLGKSYRIDYELRNITSFTHCNLSGYVSEMQVSGLKLLNSFEILPNERSDTSKKSIQKNLNWSFESIQFIGDVRVTIAEEYSLVKFGFLPYQIKKMPISYKNLDRRKEQEFNRMIYSLKNEIIQTENNKNWSQADRDDVVQWLTYLIDESRFHYLNKKIGLGPGEWFEWVWLSITRKVVNHGYQGLGAFSSWALGIVLLFSCLYFFFRRFTITHYVNTGEISMLEVKNATIKTGNNLGQLIEKFLMHFGDFFRCTWFSFVILVNPRWPVKYFKFSPGLLFVIFLEWFIGLFLLFLFVVYILSRYSFVKAFLAL